MKIHSTILSILLSLLLWQMVNIFIIPVTVIQYIIIEILVVFSIELHTLAIQKLIKNYVSKPANHNVDKGNTHL
jgi:hypothetical protein